MNIEPAIVLGPRVMLVAYRMLSSLIAQRSIHKPGELP